MTPHQLYKIYMNFAVFFIYKFLSVVTTTENKYFPVQGTTRHGNILYQDRERETEKKILVFLLLVVLTL